MADRLSAKNSDSKFRPHPEGQFVGQCVDVIDLGEKVSEFPGKATSLSHKCALVFRTGEVNLETGELVDIAQEYTVSMGEKANLRKALESWRGKPYSEEECDAGVPLDKLEGQYALVGVGNKTSGSGKKYGYIISLVAIPKQMKKDLPGFAQYERAKYWEDRRADYAKAAQKFRDDIGAGQESGKRVASPTPFSDDGDPSPEYTGDDDMDSLPF